MECTLLKKEEYDEYDQSYKQVKKEEDISLKKEETSPTTTFFPPLSPLTLDWKNNYQELSYLFPDTTQTKVSFSHLYTCQMGKPFIILRQIRTIRDPSDQINIQTRKKIILKNNTIETKQKLNSRKVVICKNYIGLVCTGFSRAVVNSDSEFRVYMNELISQMKAKFKTISNEENEDLIMSLVAYTQKNMSGKKLIKSKHERIFKIKNTRDLQNLYKTTPRDSEVVILFKKIIRNMLLYFFDSECYQEWLLNGMISDRNKLFFLTNKEQIRRKFKEPESYKPRFLPVSPDGF